MEKKMSGEIYTEKMNQIMNKSLKKFYYFYDRWQDEKEYEDWKDYTNAIQKLVSNFGGIFIKATDKPFRIFFSWAGRNIRVTVTNKELKWKEAN